MAEAEPRRSGVFPVAESAFSTAELARLYDWEHNPYTEDLELYVALARRFGGPVLELACGTGRVLEPLAVAGLACTGVDSSPAMLARARERLDRAGLSARLEQQELQQLRLEGRYRTILFPLDGLGLLLARAERLAALATMRAHATHDGRLVIDVSNGNLRGGGHEPAEELLHHLTAPDPATGRPLTKWVVRRPDPLEQVDELTAFYDEQDEDGRLRRTTTQLRLRWYTRHELELWLELGGWEVQELYGGYDMEPFGPTSERIIVVASPAAGL